MGEDVRAPEPFALYTCIFGDGYVLPQVPGWPGVDLLCFTDRDDLEPHGWTLIPVRPLLAADLVRSSRDAKIRPHRWLPDHEASLYVDPSVELLVDPRELWRALVSDDEAVFGAMLHSFRDTVLDEFAAVYAASLDVPATLTEHLTAYQLTDPDGLELTPIWGGVLARRHHDPRCVDAMEDWFAQVMRYSRRDQLSLPSVVARAPEGSVRLHALDNFKTEFHRWPRADYSRPTRYTDNVRRALLPPVLAERAERARRDEMERQLITSVAERNAANVARDEALAALASAEAEARVSQARAEQAEARQRDAERQRDAVTSSRIWRSTSWFRRLRTRGRVT